MAKKLPLLLLGAALMPLGSMAQQLKEGYFEWWPEGVNELPTAILNWEKGKELSEDDNFFISRVKPHKRFRNENTQVRPFTAENDKRLYPWLPMGDPDYRTFQNGVFDSEVFSMWSYVSAWGDWNCPIGRVPAPLLDAAHKNGVGVSSEYGIPFGGLGNAQHQFLTSLVALDVQKSADFLHYYGDDGLGFNSEYTNHFADRGQLTPKVSTFLAALYKKSIEVNHTFENIWYDGTNDYGSISFDRGLGNHNKKNFGDKDNIASSLFFNYNWGNPGLLSRSAAYAKQLGRNPLYLYAGNNIQGGQAGNWPLLKDYPISIGLWGAHSHNMFWQSRGELGSAPEVQQKTYLKRIENWFTGGNRNPANNPPLRRDLNYSATNTSFPGMSSMMSASSALNWDLSEEPFITYFNLGNGKFFNWKGERQNNNEWYNLGVQDYLPTWRFWFAPKLLQKQVTEQGLDAQFGWKDAYMGGSCLNIFGTANEEYLHLFKTKYALKAGDVITVRYKHLAGVANAQLVLTAEGAEDTPIAEDKLVVMKTSQSPDDGVWKEITYKVGNQLNGKTLALVALHFTDAKNMKIALGEFSIVRGEAVTPDAPEITSSKLFGFNYKGVDGKLIFNMANDKAAGEPCYNLDVNTSLFKVYSQQQGNEPVCLGITNSWAAMVFAAPMASDNEDNHIRLGVSAVSLDMKNESSITWTEYQEAPAYAYNDAFELNKKVIKPNESFELSFVDPRHNSAKWEILKKNKVLESGEGMSVAFENGLPEVGVYDLRVTSIFNAYNAEGVLTGTKEETKTFPGYIAVTPISIGALPQIKDFTIDNKTEGIEVSVKQNMDLAYTGNHSNGAASRGIALKEKGFIFSAEKAGITDANQPWTVAFWVKMNNLEGAQVIDIRDQMTGWPHNNWGTIWTGFYKEEKTGQCVLESVLRSTPAQGSSELKQIWAMPIVAGMWAHVALALEANAEGKVRTKLYLNGKLATPLSWAFKGRGEGEGLCPYYQDAKAWWENNNIMLGYGRHGAPAISGDIDEVKFYNKALSAAEVKKAMNENAVLDGQTVYYSFDQNADKEGYFSNEVEGYDAKGARMEGVAGDGEGQAQLKALEASYTAGTPFVPGSTFKVTTLPIWKANKGTLSDETGKDTEGSAKLQYSKDGTYDVTLTLENSYGSDSRTITAIKVGTGVGIDNITESEMNTYAVGRTVIVDFAAAGAYQVQVFGADGRLAANKQVQISGQEKVQINVANPGIYVLRVLKAGKTVRAAKLLCK